jgi:RNA polymerase-binding transcription factor
VTPERKTEDGDPAAAEAEADLRERLDEVRSRLAELKRPPERGSGIGFGKRIGDGTNEAIDRLNDVGVAGSLDTIEAQLERALAKLEDGTYGTCDSCGAPIPAARLRIRPESTRCVRCAR